MSGVDPKNPGPKIAGNTLDSTPNSLGMGIWQGKDEAPDRLPLWAPPANIRRS